MTVSATSRRTTGYIGDGSTNLPYPFSFKCFDAQELVVVVQAFGTGFETTLVQDSDYTVALHSDQNDNPGGTVSLPAPLEVSHQLMISSRMQLVQPVALATGGAFYPETIELALDRVVLIAQDLQAQLDLTFKNSAFNDGYAPADLADALNTAASTAASSATAAASSATAAASSATAAASSATAAANLVLLRNYLVNGAMAVDQRNAGASQTFTAGLTRAHCVDRWAASCTGADVTGQQVTDSTYVNAYQLTGASGVSQVKFGQRLEAGACPPANASCYLSFTTKHSAGATLTITVAAPTAADNFTTVSTVATATATLGAGTTTRSSLNFTMPSTVTGLEITLSVTSLGAAATWTITGAQLEVGGVATVYEKVPYAYELMRCQRYFRKYTGLAFSTYSTATTAKPCGTITFPPMRAAPTASGNAGTGSGAASSSTATTSTSVVVSITVSSANTNAQIGSYDLSLSAEL